MDRILTSRANRRAGIAVALGLLGLGRAWDAAGGWKPKCRPTCGKDQICVSRNECQCKEFSYDPCGKLCFDPSRQQCVLGRIVCRATAEACGSDCCDPVLHVCEGGRCVCRSELEACGVWCIDPVERICCNGTSYGRYAGCEKCCNGSCTSEKKICCGDWEICSPGEQCILDGGHEVCLGPERQYCGNGYSCPSEQKCCEIRNRGQTAYVCYRQDQPCPPRREMTGGERSA